MNDRKTIIKEKQKFMTREDAINWCVKTYVDKNPREFALFLEMMKEKHWSLADKKFGVFKEETRACKTKQNRLIGQLPQKLNDAIEKILEFHNQPRLGFNADGSDNIKEMHWFLKRYPVFRVPEKL